MEEIQGFQGFPPEGLNEPFKPLELEWSPRIPFGTGGMNRAVPADALRPDQAYTLKNFRVGLGDLRPAFGEEEIGSARATPEPITYVGLYKEVKGLTYLIRIDEDVLQYWDGSTWSEVTGTLSGGEDDRVRGAMVLDQFVFINGNDEIQTWDGTSSTYSDLTADEFRPKEPRYLAAYADRLVVADMLDSDSNRSTQRLEWSVSGDITDYTGTGSGGVTLHDGQTNAPADDIMGLATQGEFLIVLRRNSIWQGFRTGQAALPIEFKSVVQGFGVAASGSVADVDSTGVMYLGKDNVYLYHPRAPRPIPVGLPIRDRLFEVLDRTKMERVFAAYVPEVQEYWLFVPDSTNNWPVTAFVFSVEKFNEGQPVGQGEGPQQQLVWTEKTFDHEVSAAGNSQIAGLGATFSERAKNLVIGDPNGKAYSLYRDAICGDSNESFDMVYVSPQFTSGPQQSQFARINLAYTSDKTVMGRLEFSVDGGQNWRHGQTYGFTRSDAVTEKSIHVSPGVIGDSLQFRLVIKRPDRCNLRLVGFRIGFINRGPILGHGG